MARRIFIHAGQHKTGTTSVQHYVERHAAFLTAHGITPFRDWKPDLSGVADGPLPCNAKMIANALIRPSLSTPMRLSRAALPLDDAAWQSRLPALREALRDVPTDAVLMSAEAFSFLRTPAERQRLDELCDGFEWEALMFLREPASFLASWELQITHSGLATAEGAVAGQGIFDVSPKSWLVDHAAIRTFWGDQGRFLSYEEAMGPKGSVIPALLERIGLDPASAPPWDDVFLNTGAKKRQQMQRPPA